MNVLQICQNIDAASGIQGTISDTVNTSGIQTVIVNAARDAWLFIQEYRKDWTFLIDKTHFITVAGKETYVPSEVFANESEEDLGFYIRNRLFHEHRPLAFVTAEEYPYIDNTKEGKLRWYTVEPSSNTLYLSLPDDAYRVDVYYSKAPQILADATDIPFISERHHQLIVYKGLELFCNYLGNSEMEHKSAHMADVLMGGLMRQYLPQKRVNLFGGIA